MATTHGETMWVWALMLNDCETESDDDALQSFLEPCASRCQNPLVQNQ
jgi:hypothetical protein